MSQKTINKIMSAILLTGMALLAAHPALALTCRVTPGNVPIALNYHGATLTVSGEGLIGDDLLIRISDEQGEAHYQYIGKAGGLVWMKKGDVSFKNVSGVYLLMSTREMARLLDPAEQQANLIGYDALKEAAEMETQNAELKGAAASWKEEFIRFKEKQNLYAIRTGAVIRRHGQNGNGDTYQAVLEWPYQAAPGAYTVEALAVCDGKVIERAQTSLTVERAGLVKQLSELAFDNAATYGIMAVVIAVIAGFAVGMIFKKGGSAH